LAVGVLRAAVLPSLLSAAALGRGASSERPPLRLFLEAASPDEGRAREALARVADGWKDGYAPLLVDLARFMRSARPAGPGSDEVPAFDDGDTRGAGPPGSAARGAFPDPAAAPLPPSARIRQRLVRFLEKQTGQRFGDDLRRWRRWYWSRPYDPHPEYAAFKAGLYSHVDPRMAAFFPEGAKEIIRLDEVDWGGVTVNGIPPLDHPKHVRAEEASYLKDKHVVFGVSLGGEARAYPKRILAWHEMARDRLGGVELAVVYCTLCGTVIPYGAEVGGVVRTFGTSGLLYRSNKLMFDEESMSLWSTVEGKPVLGRLAGEPLELRAYPVVTTTWREWRERHPGTTVLSLETGFKRDYGEGAAYREYFATDSLMFEVPRTDDQLKNKEEVLVLVVAPEGGGPGQPVAVSVELLEKNRLYRLGVAGRTLVVVTSPDGANRVYDATGAPGLARLLPGDLVESEGGPRYRVTEEALVPEGEGASPLPRLPARRAFWFGWQAQYPDTLLVK
jgi:hypothetical protein